MENNLVVTSERVNKKKEKAWVRYIHMRIQNNKNFLGFIGGPTGSGKSWCSLRIAEELDPSFTMERCIFSGVELMKLINSGTLRKGSVIIFEEAGVGMSNRNWQSATNKMLNYLVQTFRHKNFILIMNSPYMDFVDAATRKLFHAEMITQGINKKTKEVMLKPQLIQYNARMQKFYYHRLKQSNEDGIAPIQFWNVGKPSSELLKEYEEKKTEYTTKLNQEIMAELEKAQNKEEAKTYSQTCKDCYHEWESRKEHPARCPACGTYRKKANKERNKANKGTLPMPDH